MAAGVAAGVTGAHAASNKTMVRVIKTDVFTILAPCASSSSKMPYQRYLRLLAV
jgi:hypothetical protein